MLPGLFNDYCLAALWLVLLTAGCDYAKPRGVSGTVTLDGKPLEEAVILFVPLEPGQKKTGAQIVAGRYQVAEEVGLWPGKYRVEVADDPPLSSGPHRPGQTSRTKRRSFPHRYSINSPLTLELTSDGGNEFNFELESRAR
jgi:hypothetical protein